MTHPAHRPTPPAPIPERPNLTIPWPRTRPLDQAVSAGALEEAWDAIIAPLAGQGPQSVELRIIMGTLRAVFDGMHGITRSQGSSNDVFLR